MKNVTRKRTAAKWILLLLLLYSIVITVLSYLLPDNYTVAMLSPFTILAVYLEQWADELPHIVTVSRVLVCLLAGLPLIGWLLLCKPYYAGKPMVIAPFCLLLASNLWITLSHLITSLGIKNSAHMDPTLQYVSITLRLSAVSLAVSIAVLVAVCIWRPKRS